MLDKCSTEKRSHMLDGETARGTGAREGKTMIGAYVAKPDLYTIQELLLRLTRARAEKVTMQEFITSAIRSECEKHGVKLCADT